MATAIPIEAVLAKLGPVQPRGDQQWMARCPVHEDRKASLSVALGREGTILFHCFAGCDAKSIADALNIQLSDLFRARPTTTTSGPKLTKTYDYRDLDGVLRYQVCRYYPKDFLQRRPDPDVVGGWLWKVKGFVEPLLYRLPELQDKETVYVVEGEKDADALWAAGLPATTNSGGSSKGGWKESDTAWLKTLGVKRVVLMPDNDAPGRRHMDNVAKSVKAAGLSVMLVALENVPPKEDVAWWLAHGHTKAELDALVAAKLWVLPKGATEQPPPPQFPADRDPLRWALTDLGAGESFVDREGNNVRYDHQQERWLLWNANLWHPDPHAVIYQRVHAHIRQWHVEALTIENKVGRDSLVKFLLQREGRAGTEALIAKAQTIEPVSDPGDQWDLNPWLLGVGNGIIDLRTGVLRRGERTDNVTMQTVTPFVAEAACPRWLQFLEEVFEADEPLIRYVQQALGYSLTGDMREQCFFMCVGAGSNGKSTFTGVLQALWGDYTYTTDMKTFSFRGDQGDFDMAELANRRLILASETTADCRLNEQALKNFTGGERIYAQRKYGHPFNYAPVGKIWLGMNQQPTVKDDSHGFWRRVRIIPFLRTFGGSAANPHLRDELLAEAPGILAWAVRGTLDWLANGLQCPSSVFSATESYKQAEDPLNDFIADRLDLTDPLAQTSSTKLYEVYRDYSRLQGVQERRFMTAPVFGRSLSRHFQKHRTENGTRYLGVRVSVKAHDLLD